MSSILDSPKPEVGQSAQSGAVESSAKKAEISEPKVGGVSTWTTTIEHERKTTHLELLTIDDLITDITFELSFGQPLVVPNHSPGDWLGRYQLQKISASGVTSSKNIERKLSQSNQVVRLLVAETNAELHLWRFDQSKTVEANLRLVVEPIDNRLLRGAFRLTSGDPKIPPAGQGIFVRQTGHDEFAFYLRSPISLGSSDISVKTLAPAD